MRTARKSASPTSVPLCTAVATASARHDASAKPRLTPCPASGCTECAASPMSATRRRTYLHMVTGEAKAGTHECLEPFASGHCCRSTQHRVQMCSGTAFQQDGRIGSSFHGRRRQKAGQKQWAQRGRNSAYLPAWQSRNGKERGGPPAQPVTSGGAYFRRIQSGLSGQSGTAASLHPTRGSRAVVGSQAFSGRSGCQA